MNRTTSEASEVRRAVRRFVEEHVTPHVDRWERERHFPREVIAGMGEEGFFRPGSPNAGPSNAGPSNAGSFGLGAVEVALAEELGASLAVGLSISVFAHLAMAVPVLDRLARGAEVRRWVEDARAGRALLGLAATEAESGSDMNAIRTKARIEEDTIRVDGVKRYITNGTQADALIVLARLAEGREDPTDQYECQTEGPEDPADRHPDPADLEPGDREVEGEATPWSWVLVLVPATTPGVTSTRLAASGLRSGDLAEVALRECRVPADHLLGEPARGFFHLLGGLQRERLLGAIGVNALASEVLDRTIERSRSRVRMGEPLLRKQSVRHRLAEQEARLHASRHFAYAVAERFGRGEPVDREIWMLKVFCYETAQDVVRVCAHLLGAEALLDDHWMARVRRDAQAFTLAAGTSEIMKEMLAAGYQSG